MFEEIICTRCRDAVPQDEAIDTMCVDCYDSFSRMDLEQQVEELMQ